MLGGNIAKLKTKSAIDAVVPTKSGELQKRPVKLQSGYSISASSAANSRSPSTRRLIGSV